MATLETQILDEVIVNSRRKMMTLGGAALAAMLLGETPKAEAQSTVTDTDILNFALNLEYLEAQFYTLAAYGVTIDKLPTPIKVSVNGGTAGTVTTKPGFAKVPFSNSLFASFATETAIEEGKHVSFLQTALGSSAVSMPNIDLYNSFNALASAAGIGAAFDPFANDDSFFVGAYIFEDVGVSAYGDAAALISDKTNILPAAAGIHAVEAYHAGMIRTAITGIDAGNGNTALSSLTVKISAARSMLANPTGASTTTFAGAKADDMGLTTTMVALNGSAATYPSATIVDCDANAVAWSRTTSQVLAIVTGTQPTASTHQGVFFPNGLNGKIK